MLLFSVLHLLRLLRSIVLMLWECGGWKKGRRRVSHTWSFMACRMFGLSFLSIGLVLLSLSLGVELHIAFFFLHSVVLGSSHKELWSLQRISNRKLF